MRENSNALVLDMLGRSSYLRGSLQTGHFVICKSSGLDNTLPGWGDWGQSKEPILRGLGGGRGGAPISPKESLIMGLNKGLFGLPPPPLPPPHPHESLFRLVPGFLKGGA